MCEYAGERISDEEARRRWSNAERRREGRAVQDAGLGVEEEGEEQEGEPAGNYILCLREYLADGTCFRTNIDPTRIGNIA